MKTKMMTKKEMQAKCPEGITIKWSAEWEEFTVNFKGGRKVTEGFAYDTEEALAMAIHLAKEGNPYK
jgi:hypothetical protein